MSRRRCLLLTRSRNPRDDTEETETAAPAVCAPLVFSLSSCCFFRFRHQVFARVGAGFKRWHEGRRQEAGMLLGGNQDSASVSWNRTTTTVVGWFPWQPAVEERRGGREEERWQTPNYLAARLLASLVCAPLHMFYAYETRNVINRLAAAANSRCGKIRGKPTQKVVSMWRLKVVS